MRNRTKTKLAGFDNAVNSQITPQDHRETQTQNAGCRRRYLDSEYRSSVALGASPREGKEESVLFAFGTSYI